MGPTLPAGGEGQHLVGSQTLRLQVKYHLLSLLVAMARLGEDMEDRLRSALLSLASQHFPAKSSELCEDSLELTEYKAVWRLLMRSLPWWPRLGLPFSLLPAAVGGLQGGRAPAGGRAAAGRGQVTLAVGRQQSWDWTPLLSRLGLLGQAKGSGKELSTLPAKLVESEGRSLVASEGCGMELAGLYRSFHCASLNCMMAVISCIQEKIDNR